MEQSIKDKLFKLKGFKTKLDKNNIEEFNKLIESIKKDLSGSYKNRFSVLKFYELYEGQSDYDDLPF